MSLNQRTRIDWADYTWNPVWGCRGSCPYCYARATARRFGLQVAGRDDFAPTWIERNFRRPLPKQPARIFVNSMSDVADWEPEWWSAVLRRIRDNPQHRFLFLTKSPVIYHMLLFPENCWLGATATTQNEVERHQETLAGPLRFLSIEPILEWIDPRRLDPDAINWIIVGAETGNRRDRVVPELAWLQQIYTFCRHHGIPLFFKASLRHLWPADAYFPQEYPE